MDDIHTETKKWIHANTGVDITDDQARCLEVLASVQRLYNLNLIGGGWHDVRAGVTEEQFDDGGPPVLPAVVFGKTYVIVRIQEQLATYDGAELTRLVLAAHERAVRVGISAEQYRWVNKDEFIETWDGEKWVDTDEHPSGTNVCLRVTLHARQREGNLTERHPSIEDVLAVAR